MNNDIIKIYFKLQNNLLKILGKPNPLIKIINSTEEIKYGNKVKYIEFKISNIPESFAISFHQETNDCIFYSFNET